MPGYQGLRVRKLADKTDGTRERRLLVRNITLLGNGTAIVRPEDVEAILWDPATPDEPEERTAAGLAEHPHDGWPLAGVALDQAPYRTMVSQRLLQTAKAEGWATLEGEKVVHAAGGPPADEWRVTHTFVEATRVVFHTADGDVAYRVVEGPGKHPDTDDPSGYRVSWVYKLEREEA